jgi:hypothetical protein
MKYRMVVEFDAERALTSVELESLEVTVYTQVAEPQVLGDPDSDWEDAEYWTKDVRVQTAEVTG